MTKSKIELEYNRAIQEAKKLEDTADHIRAVGKKRIDELKAGYLSHWIGESSAAFSAELDEISQKLIAEAKQLDNIANSIKKVARVKLDADSKIQDLVLSGGGSGGGGGGGF
ncbi:MAG: WXG100 family type VII secretion target [Erysipelotrichaceae bacterium]